MAVFAEQLATQKSAIAVLEGSERSLAGQLARGVRRIVGASVTQLGQLIRSRLADDVQFRAYTRLFVTRVTVSDTAIPIAGAKAALEAAVVYGRPERPAAGAQS